MRGSTSNFIAMLRYRPVDSRDAVPTARVVLTAFAGLHATFTTTGLVLDRLIQPNGSSSPTSTSPYHGPRRALPHQHPINQAMTSDYAESGAS